jgi:hypothetical protein
MKVEPLSYATAQIQFARCYRVVASGQVGSKVQVCTKAVIPNGGARASNLIKKFLF